MDEEVDGAHDDRMDEAGTARARFDIRFFHEDFPAPITPHAKEVFAAARHVEGVVARPGFHPYGPSLSKFIRVDDPYVAAQPPELFAAVLARPSVLGLGTREEVDPGKRRQAVAQVFVVAELARRDEAAAPARARPESTPLTFNGTVALQVSDEAVFVGNDLRAHRTRKRISWT